jgi:hypothetical protein
VRQRVPVPELKEHQHTHSATKRAVQRRGESRGEEEDNGGRKELRR